MSQYTVKTGLSSILKDYSIAEREKLKLSAINKVRFQLPKEKGLLYIVEDVLNGKSYLQYREFIEFLSVGDVTDEDFLRVIKDARKIIHTLKPETFPGLVETIMSINWINRNEKIIEYFKELIVDILVAHNKYANIIVGKILNLWIPEDDAKTDWIRGPNKMYIKKMTNVHDLIERLLNVMPMLYSVLTDNIEGLFPYYKKPPHVVGGYIYNCLWFIRYRNDFTNFVIEMLIKNLLKIDVNAPRNEIEDAEDEISLHDNIADEAIFQMDNFEDRDLTKTMAHEVAEVLDVCLEKLFEFSKETFNNSSVNSTINGKKKDKLVFSNYFNMLLDVFEKIILPSHNTHHVQFLIFHCCGFKNVYAENFLKFLWNKVTNPNVSGPIRQALIGYVASFLSRSKFLPLSVVRMYLSEMCNWAHQYIERSDSIGSNISLRANLVFFAVCQAIFYVIAFRSKDLTKDKPSLLFLQTLQLSALVTCTFNPLRVCLPAVATAFAGVTRAYQLAYCHTILERNARRKLATVYTNDLMTPEECLDTFFPFDPFLLKKSGEFITPIYLQYQASEVEEIHAENDIIGNSLKMNRRKRGDSEMEGDDIDDFIIDKKFKNELSKSYEKEMQFTYGLSPGFHS